MFNLSNRPASRRLAESAAILGMMLGASACNFDTKSNCATEPNGVAADPANDFSVEHNLPKSCPVSTQQGGTRTDYAAVVRAISNRLQSPLFLILTDWNQLEITHADYTLNISPKTCRWRILEGATVSRVRNGKRRAKHSVRRFHVETLTC
jgi:hypothetical protein